MQMTKMKINYLEYIDTDSTGATTQEVTVCLFHGYGADAQDLASLHEVIRINPELKTSVQWLFPEGVHQVPIAPMYSGRAWWNLKLSELPGDWSQYSPDNIDDLVENINAFLDSKKIDRSRLIIGGFSQGAMLATELYLRSAVKPLGLMSLSGSLIRQPVWAELASKRTGENIFLSHGEQDPVLPCRGTNKLLELFKKNQIHCDFVSFSGGHEIPQKVILRMQQYIENQVKLKNNLKSANQAGQNK